MSSVINLRTVWKYAVPKIRFSPFTIPFKNLNPASNWMADMILFLHWFILGAEPSTMKHCALLTRAQHLVWEPFLPALLHFTPTSQWSRFSLLCKSVLSRWHTTWLSQHISHICLAWTSCQPDGDCLLWMSISSYTQQSAFTSSTVPSEPTAIPAMYTVQEILLNAWFLGRNWR